MRAGQADDGADGLRRFAAIWSRAIYPATATSMTRAEFEEYLVPLAQDLSDALRARPFDPRPAVGVGAALVAAHCTDPEALPRILGVIDAYLLLYCPADDTVPTDEARARCARLQHWTAAGFASALRERTLFEQEAISRAALAARTEAEQALYESEARFRAVFEGASIGIGIADMDGNILEVNDALTQMFGGSEQTVRSRNVNEWVHPDDGPGTWEMQRQVARGELDQYSIEKPYLRPDGTVLWTNLTVSLLRDSAGAPQYMLALMEDITEQRLMRERLRYEATHDALTGLANRTLFFERLEEALDPADGSGSGAARLGLCYLDLDGFKDVNDSLGHATGDLLLVAVAERLQACVTSPGQLVARIGGDEFVALIVDPADRSEVAALAELIHTALADPISVDGRDLSVRCSIGIVEGPAGALGPAEVLRSADITMYRAKAAGGNRSALADPDADARAITRHGLTNRLPTALERGEFFVEYQPLVRLSDGSVRGAEALVRWHHPVHGRLGPDRFIPLAESTGLIVPLGRLILAQACHQQARWRQVAGVLVPVAVNVSPLQLLDPSFPDMVANTLRQYEVPPALLTLEITESAAVTHLEQARQQIQALRDHGVEVALDDFGTGFSSLNLLRSLPISTVKIDRTLIEPLPAADAAAVVKAICTLAAVLRLDVVAEGVETEAQAEAARQAGCHVLQGALYASPLTADDAQAWLTRTERRPGPNPQLSQRLA